MTEQLVAVPSTDASRYKHPCVHHSGAPVVGIDSAAGVIVLRGSSDRGEAVSQFTSTSAASYPRGTTMRTQTGEHIESVAVDLTTNTVFFKRFEPPAASIVSWGTAPAASVNSAGKTPAASVVSGGNCSARRGAALCQGQVPPAVFFDFDGTVSVSMYIERFQNYAVSDGGREHILAALSPSEVVENFGGPHRLEDLREFLGFLKGKRVSVIIVSHGKVEPIKQHLQQVDLLWAFDSIYASDSPELRRFRGGSDDKTKLIKSIMEEFSMDLQRSVFVEDTEANLVPAREMGVCKTKLVGRGNLNRAGMQEIAIELGLVFR